MTSAHDQTLADRRFCPVPTPSSRRPVRLQVPAEFGVADECVLGQVNSRTLVIVSDRREMIPAGVAASAVVPIDADSQDVVEIPFVDRILPASVHELQRSTC